MIMRKLPSAPGVLSSVSCPNLATGLALSLLLLLGWIPLVSAQSTDSKSGQIISESARALVRVCGNRSIERRMDAMKKLSAFPLDVRIPALVDGLKSWNPKVRSFCCFQMGALGAASSLGSLARMSLKDPNSTVRGDALRAYKRLGVKSVGPEMIQPFITVLGGPEPMLRIRAAEALGTLGQAGAVPALMKAFNVQNGGGAYRAPSNHVFIGSEKALVTDFDVEIAQAAVIADPKISHVRQGAQLEARILALDAHLVIRQKVAVGRALESLTGQNYGANQKMWSLWWASLGSNEKQYKDSTSSSVDESAVAPEK